MDSSLNGTQSVKHFDRSLGFFAVVAISIGAMLGSGIFVLPGLAAAMTGPSVWLAYVVAGLCALPAALSKAELATAMPESGGTYVYIDRTFGPLAGTIAGLGLWLSLLLKSAFALVGFGAYLAVLADLPLQPAALTMLAGILLLNIFGVRNVGKVQMIVIGIALVCLSILVALGIDTAWPNVFAKPQLSFGSTGLITAAAFVFVSFAGVTKAAAIAEEVKNPSVNLPAGIIFSLVLVTLIYAAVVFVMVGNIPEEVFTGTTRPVYELAAHVGGPTVALGGALLGVLTMASMANAGVLASSRFPFAMSRDNLLPPQLHRIHSRFNTPYVAVLVTGVAMAASILLFDVEKLAKLASSFVILLYVVVNATVIILRESSPQWYKPGYRSPLYPIPQVFGILSGVGLLAMMIVNALIAVGSVFVLGIVLYAFYGRKRTERIGELVKLGPRPDLGLVQTRDGSAASETPGDGRKQVVVNLFGNERSPEAVVEMGIALADEERLVVRHLTEIQERYVDEPYLEMSPRLRSLRRRLRAMGEDKQIDLEFEALATRDLAKTVHAASRATKTACVVMAWRGRKRTGRILRNPLSWLVGHMQSNSAIFKDAGVRYFRKIMVYAVPGPHDALVAATADHMAQIHGAKLTFVRFVADGVPDTIFQSQIDYLDELRYLCEAESSVRILRGKNLLDALTEETTFHDLLVLGAPRETGMHRLFIRSIEDQVTEAAACSVLQVRTPRAQTHATMHSASRVTGTVTRATMRECMLQDSMRVKLTAPKKEALFAQFARALEPCVPASSAAEIEKALWDRERTQNTAVGNGLALPHATLEAAAETVLTVFTTSTEVNYDPEKGQTADIFILTLGPPSGRQTHLELLANVAELVSYTDLVTRLRKATTVAAAAEAIRECSKQLSGGKPASSFPPTGF